MRIVLASSEAVPFSKTGGLADVASALSKALDRAGHDVWLVTPHYSQLSPAGTNHELLQPTGETIEVTVGSKQVTGTLLSSQLPRSDVKVILVDQPSYFGRPQLYSENGNDYKDNCERFVFFSRAVLEVARRLDLRPDVLHANDWQTGLVPALLNIEYAAEPGFENTVSVFTIHNLAFQGRFWHWDMLLTGLDWRYFNWRQMEFFDSLNMLKTGIVFCDVITTVSPTYAREIQTPEFGCGLNEVLSERRDNLVGILNGVDTDVWDPATDPVLKRNYSIDDVSLGKSACKADLQQLMGLPVRSEVPLFGMISRMTGQKGLDLLAQCADDMLEHDLQICFLGTGEQQYERLLQKLAEDHPQKISAKIGFDDVLAHRIEAGVDLYLMPSRYEPCGLNQMYSLMYGTVPIVRTVGGLADSVVDASEENLNAGTATGFCFSAYSGTALAEQVQRAVTTYRDPARWLKLVHNGMRQDWSWNHSAREYLDVYKQAVSKRATEPAGSLS